MAQKRSAKKKSSRRSSRDTSGSRRNYNLGELFLAGLGLLLLILGVAIVASMLVGGA